MGLPPGNITYDENACSSLPLWRWSCTFQHRGHISHFYCQRPHMGKQIVEPPYRVLSCLCATSAECHVCPQQM